MPKQVFTFKDVIVASIVADRINKGYIRESNFTYNEKTERYVPVSVGNKNIMREILFPGTSIKDDMAILGKTSITAIESDFDIADEMCGYVEGLAFKALSNELQGYEKSLYSAYESNELTSFDFGLLASFPSSFKRTSKKEEIEVEISRLCADNGYIGKVGEKIEADIKIMNHIFSRNYNAHIYTAITAQNNLLNFWSQKSPSDLAVIGASISITAKVKRTSNSKFYPGIAETQLNYVKKIKGWQIL